MSDDDKVKPLPVRFKRQDEPRTLQVVSYDGACDHKKHWVGNDLREVTYKIRDGETEVECGVCGTRLNPMFVLMRIASQETGFTHTRKVYQEEMKRLSERSKTQCNHCGKMTRISRTKPNKAGES